MTMLAKSVIVRLNCMVFGHAENADIMQPATYWRPGLAQLHGDRKVRSVLVRDSVPVKRWLRWLDGKLNT